MSFPIDYQEPLFRPPSEARSLILQVTIGCSNNDCAFCDMYKTKKFTTRRFADIQKEIQDVAKLNMPVQKVFLADGDAFVLSTKKLLEICNEINAAFPKVRRISSYALPSNINKKSIEELKELKAAGIKMLYIGIESGDDELLDLITKKETFDSSKSALLKLKEVGIKSSVMVLTGLGGKNYSQQHALQSAQLLNETQPDYASTLVLSFPFGVEKYKQEFKGDYIEMSKMELLMELKIFIENVDLESTIFRSDHASNYLVLKGVLGKDKTSFLQQINHALDNSAVLRKEWMRGL
ncbi:MAG: radical SAM superfamily enzyme YgiQ (UPF0313 family) [Planctomycetota bacterium]|jgi:radical SAM superfamily enzyme YgiQ (UPF0313 family)